MNLSENLRSPTLAFFFFEKMSKSAEMKMKVKAFPVSYGASTVDKEIWNPRREKAVGGRGII